MNKKLDVYQKAAILLLIIGVIVICWGFAVSTGKIISEQGQKSKMIEPDAIHKIDKQTTEYIFNFDYGKERLCLYFVSDLEEIHIYQDEKLIYSVDEEMTPIGKTPGKIFHFIKIPSEKCMITVVSQNKYANDNSLDFLIGDRQLMFREKLIQSLPYMGIYFMIFLGGVMLFFYWGIVRKELLHDKIGLYFSLLLIVTGLWLMRGSDFINLLIQDHRAIYFMGYILFLQIPFLFFAFTVHYWQSPCKLWVKNIYYVVSCVNMLICILLHVFGIKEFKDTAFVTHILLMFAFLYAFYGMYIYWKEHKFNYKMILTAIPLSLIFISAIVDYLLFYKKITGSYKRGGITILFFLICISVVVFYELSLQLREGRKNAIYRKLAVTDLLTGLNNRNAYETWENEHKEDFSGVSIVLCDLNNLKYYNDNYGHELGDKYIIAASEILSKAIGDKGVCYRIGGDEFIVVFKNTASAIIKECFEKMEVLQKEFNKNSEPLVMEMAYGYSSAEETDTSITEVIKRADTLMYKHKKQIKAERTKNG